MKNLSLLLFFAVFAQQALAQSSFEIFSQGVKKGHYVPIKGEEIKPNTEYSYIFSSQTSYLIKVTGVKTNRKMSIKILDENKKEVISNFNKKKYHTNISYKCPKAGKYYIVFSEI